MGVVGLSRLYAMVLARVSVHLLPMTMAVASAPSPHATNVVLVATLLVTLAAVADVVHTGGSIYEHATYPELTLVSLTILAGPLAGSDSLGRGTIDCSCSSS